jgi:hypothetical protein
VGELADLDEAIELGRQALNLRSPPHSYRGGSFNNLANAVRERFEQRGDPEDIDEAIRLGREAMVVFAPPHPNRDVALNVLANSLRTH